MLLRAITRMLLVFSVLVAGAAPAQEQQPLKFRMGTVQGEGIFTEGQRKFARLVGERTGGKVQIEHFCCNQLGGERQLADGLSLGTLGMAVIGATGSQTMDLLFTPFLFRDRDHALKVVNGPIGDKWADDYYKQTNLRLIGYILQGPRQFLTNKRAIRTPADAKGLKIRAPELPVVVASLKALGASPVVIAFPELYTALQQGTADGWEGPVNVMYDAKQWEVGKYLSLASWIYNFNYLIANDDVWKKMTPATQTIVRNAWRESMAEVEQKLFEAEKTMIDEFRKRGVEVVTPDVGPFREATKDVWKDFAPKTWGPGVYEQVQAVK
jgi:tripartite ATP-independent transporter DctP family solute receptor